jgi:hypothetical protein
MNLSIKPCPCGNCSKWVISPILEMQDASISLELAAQIVARWNFFEGEENAERLRRINAFTEL